MFSIHLSELVFMKVKLLCTCKMCTCTCTIHCPVLIFSQFGDGTMPLEWTGLNKQQVSHINSECSGKRTGRRVHLSVTIA